MIRLVMLSLFALLPIAENSADEINFAKMRFADGFLSMYLDEAEGKIYLSISSLDTDFLYINGLTTGVGSNDIGLDRGLLGNTRLVVFRRSGNKLFLVHKNTAYRASSTNKDEIRAVTDAFAESVLWGFTIISTDKSRGNYVVDATDFFVQDTLDISGRMNSLDQGAYALDKTRSSIHMPLVKNFPNNTEIETMITLTGDAVGAYIRSVTPTSDAITVRQRHSFVRLPDDSYEPRQFDPRAGFNAISFMDFATPIDEPIVKRYIARHRLVKKDPSALISEPVEPIVYFLDRGTPEPIRSALLEGGNWWAEAFEAAGFKNALQVKLAPPDMDFLDSRYNVIQWVHRSTRGWSYGQSIVDPRTGEIIKGHVSLGSLRVRQDFLIAQGLLQPFADNQARKSEMLELALARLRQLSAHEIGHTIGLAHNFASSSMGRSSVMDYPYPKIALDDQAEIDFSQAYDSTIGEWDKRAIVYGYGYPGAGVNEEEFLKTTLLDTYSANHEFITDADARDPAGMHPRAHLWDNGSSPAGELIRLMELRENRLNSFGLNSIQEGQPQALIEETLVPLYLMHRYQLEATAKLIGGQTFSYKVKGDNQPSHSWVAKEQQIEALQSLLRAIGPDQLEIPSHILNLLAPRPFGYKRNRETFMSRMGPLFDPIAAAENIVDIVLELMLNPSRLNRVRLQHLNDNENIGLDELLNLVSDQIFPASIEVDLQGEIALMVETKWINHLILLANGENLTYVAKTIVRAHLQQLRDSSTATGVRGLRFRGSESSILAAHSKDLAQQIDLALKSPLKTLPKNSLKVPDGSPIGSTSMECSLAH